MIETTDKFIFADRSYSMGSRVEIGESRFDATLDLYVPLTSAKGIDITVSGTDDEHFPLVMDTFTDDIISVPTFNAPFHHELAGRRGNLRTINGYLGFLHQGQRVGTYAESLHVLSLSPDQRKQDPMVKKNKDSFFYRKYDQERVGDEVLRPENYIEYDDRETLTEILDNHGFTFDKLKNRQLYTVVNALSKFIFKTGDRTQLGSSEFNLMDLLEYYKSNRKFPGVCKANATLMVAMCDILGIPARRLEGMVVDLDYKRNEMHTWPEVYHPMLDRWFLADPSVPDAGMNYPQIGLNYFIQGQVQIPAGQTFSLQVSAPERGVLHVAP